MEWKNYSKIKGQHAFLGASKFSWLNYDEEKLATSYFNFLAVARGTRLHALAAEHIELGIKMPKTKKTLDCYINDAIGFGMKPEQVLFYSDNCFGTADAIAFKKNFLRIHDLKTGITPAHFEQLQIYAALFCLDYKFQPEKLDMELRIYQNDDISIVNTYDNPELREDVRFIADKIVEFDRVLAKIKEN
jgi:hypothetical protein